MKTYIYPTATAALGARDAAPYMRAETDLARLRHLLRRKRDHWHELTDEARNMVSRAIYATLCDLIECGAKDQAAAILWVHQHSRGSQ